MIIIYDHHCLLYVSLCKEIEDFSASILIYRDVSYFLLFVSAMKGFAFYILNMG